MIPLLLAAVLSFQQDVSTEFVYEVSLLRAAPGQLLALMDQLQDRMTVYDAAGDQRPAMLRHSQGDHWDLMLIRPIGSLETYYSSERVNQRRVAAEQSGLSQHDFDERLQRFISWREETLFTGPAISEVD